MRNHTKKTSGKLSLSKETLRQLAPPQLRTIAGGVPTEGCTPSCTSGHSNETCNTCHCNSHGPC